jgi:hypothetical protein
MSFGADVSFRPRSPAPSAVFGLAGSPQLVRSPPPGVATPFAPGSADWSKFRV